MSILAAVANGNLTSSSTWGLIDATSYLNSETGVTALTTAYVISSTFTPGAITIDGIAVKIGSITGTGPSGAITAHLETGGVEVTGTAVTVNVTDLPGSSLTTGQLCSSATTTFATSEGGWFFFKFAAPVLLLAATAYSIAAKTSVASGVSTVNLWRDSTAANWSRYLRTTTTQAPVAGDDMIVTKEWTAAATGTARTVTMDQTATTAYGNGVSASALVTPALAICQGGTLTFGNSASTAYKLYLAGCLIIYYGGTLNIGSSGNEIPRNSTALLHFACVAAGDFGLIIRNGGTANTAGLSRTVGLNVVKAKLNINRSLTPTYAASAVIAAVGSKLSVNMMVIPTNSGGALPSPLDQPLTVTSTANNGGNARFLVGASSSLVVGQFINVAAGGIAGIVQVSAIPDSTHVDIAVAFVNTSGGIVTPVHIYFVVAANLTADQFSVATTIGGTAITMAGAGSGTQSIQIVDAAAGEVNLTSDVSTGWLSGDALAVAATNHPTEDWLSGLTATLNTTAGGQCVVTGSPNGATANGSRPILAGMTVPVLQAITSNNGAASPCIFTLAGSNMGANLPCFLTTNGTLPAPFVDHQIYYVVAIGANTWSLSLTPGGTAINTTTAGSGTHSIQTLNTIASQASGTTGGNGTYNMNFSQSASGATIANSRSETGTLSGNATSTNLPITGFAGAGGGLAFTHSGYSGSFSQLGQTYNWSIQAEIVLLTRNVVIEGASLTATAYVSKGANAAANYSWTEFRFLGANAPGKRGIEEDSIASFGGSLTMSFCSLHHTSMCGLFLATNATNGGNFTIQHLTEFDTGHCFGCSNTINQPLNNGNWVIDDVVSVGGGMAFPAQNGNGSANNNYCWNMAGTRGQFTNITVTDSASMGVNVLPALPNAAIAPEAAGTWGPITVHSALRQAAGQAALHSGASWQANIAGYYGWRINGDIIYTEGGQVDLTIDPCFMWSSSATNDVLAGLGVMTLRNGVMGSDVAYLATGTIGLDTGIVGIFDNMLFNPITGTAGIFCPNGTANAVINGGVIPGAEFAYLFFNTAEIVIRNCRFNGITYTGQPSGIGSLPNSVAGFNNNYIAASKINGVVGNDKLWLKSGLVFPDTTIQLAGKQSMRLVPISAVTKLRSAQNWGGFKVPVASGVPVTVSVSTRKSLAGDTGGTFTGQLQTSSANMFITDCAFGVVRLGDGIIGSGISGGTKAATYATNASPIAPLGVYTVNNAQTVPQTTITAVGQSYSGSQQRLICLANPALGIMSDTVLATASGAAGATEQLVGTSPTPNADGVLEFIVDCDSLSTVASSVTIASGSNSWAWAANGLFNGQFGLLTTTGELPAPFVANTPYWVIGQATNTLSLALTPLGAAITTTSAGNGTHTLTIQDNNFGWINVGSWSESGGQTPNGGSQYRFNALPFDGLVTVGGHIIGG